MNNLWGVKLHHKNATFWSQRSFFRHTVLQFTRPTFVTEMSHSNDEAFVHLMNVWIICSWISNIPACAIFGSGAWLLFCLLWTTVNFYVANHSKILVWTATGISGKILIHDILTDQLNWRKRLPEVKCRVISFVVSSWGSCSNSNYKSLLHSSE